MASALSPAVSATFPALRLRWSAPRVALTFCLLLLVAWAALGLGDGGRLVAAVVGLWARPELLVLFAATYTAAFYLRALAWRLLLPDSPSVFRLLAILQVALLANHLFPTKAGEVVRMGLLARRGVPAGAAVSSTLLARLVDFAALCLIVLVVGPLAGGRLDALLAALVLPLAGISFFALGCLLLASGRLRQLGSHLPRPSHHSSLITHHSSRLLDQTRVALATVSTVRLVAAFAIVVPSWVLEAGALWSMAQAAGVPLSPAIAVAATAFTIAFQGFQVTPGGIGLYEASLTAVLALFGVDPATGLALAVATHGLKFAYSYLAGFPSLISEGLGRSDNVGSGGSGIWTRSATVAFAAPWSGFLRSVRGIGRWAERVGAWSRLDLAPALIAYLVLQPAAWAEGSWWLASLAGLLATAPLLVLGRCHHLPRGLTPLLIGLAMAFLALFGLPAPIAGLVAALLAGLAVYMGHPPQLTTQPTARNALLRLRQVEPTVLLWPCMLAQSLAAGAREPLGVGAFGLAALVSAVLLRQWWLTRRPLPPPAPPSVGGLVAIVIPVHNEAVTLASVVDRVPRSALEGLGFESRIVVVDDGSTDGSSAVARAAGADLVLRHSARRGLGAALRTGLAAAHRGGAAAAVYLDGDGEYDPADVPAVAGPVLRGEADYVLGSRFPAAAGEMHRSRRWGNRLFTALLSLLIGARLRDGQTGFRAFSARALARAEILHDYNYAQVLTLDLLRKGMRLAQVPIGYRTRRHGTSFIRYREYLWRVLPAIAREVLAP